MVDRVEQRDGSALCVLLWPRPGATEALIAYEDKILALLDEHGGRILLRAR